MHAPEPRVYLYLLSRFSVIPVERNGKRPHEGLLPGLKWGPYQVQPATREVVAGWHAADPECNWGLVCGQVSGGLYCGDCDDEEFAQWVLDHANDVLFNQACVEETSSGKAHIWVRSAMRMETHIWKWRDGPRMGELRGDGTPDKGGSYAVCPGSWRDGKESHEVRGRIETLPYIDNPEAFLNSVLAAYRQESPGTVTAIPRSTRILRMEADDTLRWVRQVKDLRLKKRIEDTILVPGLQSPGSQHWPTASDRSTIDFYVTCELLRKGLDIDQVEEVFATQPIGDNCYRARHGHSGSIGRGYIEYTYGNARKVIDKQVADARLAKGANFSINQPVTTMQTDKDRIYRFEIEYTAHGMDPVLDRVEIDAETLFQEQSFLKEVFKQTGYVLELNTNQSGRHGFATLVSAIDGMVVEREASPPAATRIGYLALELESWIAGMIAQQGPPLNMADAPDLGWRNGDVYYLRLRDIARRFNGMRVSFKHSELRLIMEAMGPWRYNSYTWGPGNTETMIRLDRSVQP